MNHALRTVSLPILFICLFCSSVRSSFLQKTCCKSIYCKYKPQVKEDRKCKKKNPAFFSTLIVAVEMGDGWEGAKVLSGNKRS